MTSFRNVPSLRLRYVTSDVKLLAVLLLVFGLLVSPFGAGAIESETAPDVRRHIQQRLEKSPNEPVGELYALAGFEPLWYGTAGARIARHALLVEIGRRPFYGLSVDTPCAAGYGEDKSPIAQAAADIALSKCFLDLRSAIAHGSASQKELGDWHLAGDVGSLVTVDIERIRGGHIRDLLIDAAPQSTEYAGLQRALAGYFDIEAKGGWRPIEGDAEVLLDGTDARVTSLAKRLATEAYLPPDGYTSPQALVSAVRRFQADKGLAVDGRVGRQTLAALNVPVAERITQIAVNMERWRHVPRSFGKSYVAVNVADATLMVVHDNIRAAEMRTIIGDVKHQTPTFDAKITGVTVNPAWTIPASIARKEILPKLKRNRRYLAENEIVILNREADPFGLQVDWAKISGERFPFQLRQRPGSKNPLGLVKFEMSNPFDVYLHDTPAKTLFALPRRGLSHGCVRVEEPEALALHLLPNQTMEQIKAVISKGETTTLPVTQPLPVYVLYWTAFVSEKGEVNFRDDLYGRDPAIARALRLHRTSPPFETNPLVSKDNCSPFA